MNKEIVQFLTDNVKGKTCKELADLINNKYKTTYKPGTIKHYKRKYNLCSGLKGKKVEEEVLQFLTDNVEGRSCEELANLINVTFNTSYTASQIQSYKRYYKLPSKLDCKFKKNNTPHNKKEIGYEFVDKRSGYTYIKINEPNEWVFKHRYIYEQYYGEIPKGYSVIFLDQNKNNFRKENLVLVKTPDKLVAKNLKLFSKDADVTRTGLMVARLINKTHEKKVKKKRC